MTCFLPASAAPVSVTAADITYATDDANVGAGATVTDFTGPAPTAFSMTSDNQSFPHVQESRDLIISYPWREDACNGGGFSAGWEGYLTNIIRDEFTATFDFNSHGPTTSNDQIVLDGVQATEPAAFDPAPV